jgi:O-antigen ligase
MSFRAPSKPSEAAGKVPLRKPVTPARWQPPADDAALSADPAQQTEHQSNFSLWMTALLLITHFARPFEIVLKGYHIPAVICTLGVGVAIFCGALSRLRSPIGIALTAFIGWMIVATPASTWRTGSIQYVLWYIVFWVVLMVMIAQTPRTAKDLARLGALTGICCLFSILVGGDDSSGRLAASGTFGNADDVALMAGYAIPFTVLWAQRFKDPILRYSLMAVAVGYLLLSVFRTATRAAIPAALLMFCVYFFRSNTLQKFLLILTLVVVGPIVFLMLPQTTITRLATIVYSFDSESVNQMQGDSEAMASTAERRDLLSDAIKMTIDNPVFGVGPGEFPDYRHEHLRYANGDAKRFFPSHNTFAQIASESGIPGLLLYLLFLWNMIRTCQRVRKLSRSIQHPDSNLFEEITTCIEAAFLYFLACAFFMTCDRHPHQFVIAGMAISMEVLLRKIFADQAATSETPDPETPDPPYIIRQPASPGNKRIPRFLRHPRFSADPSLPPPNRLTR